MNRTQAAFLLACLTFFLVAMEHAFVGRTGVITAFLLAITTCFSTLWRSPEVDRRFVFVACKRPDSSNRRPG